jgi:acyl-CoA synthetase (AMP-forming)/AMP-acid ligase II
LIEYAKSVLPVYKCPRVIRILKELPHLSDGRINKGLLGDERP